MFVPLFVGDVTPPPTLPITETWDVPDQANTMTGVFSWTPYFGTNAWGVVNHRLRLANAGTGVAQGGRLQVNLGTSDYRVTALVPTFTHPGTGTLVASVCTRMQGDTSFTFYALDLFANFGTYELLLLSFVNSGTPSVLGSTSISQPIGTSLLALETNGSTIRGFYNSARVFNVTGNTDIPTGQFAGVQGVANGVGNMTELDTLVVSAPITAIPHRRRSLAPLTGVR